jgi:Helicase conserved C-terminal domain
MHRPADPSSSGSALTDPAVNGILDDLKRLTEQLSFPETTTSKPRSTNQNSFTFQDTSRSAQIRARRVVSQFIPMWLRREPTWKVAVLQHLQLPTHLDTNSHNRATSGAAALPGQNFYPDSIPSFVEVLKQGPPESLYEALDHLVEAGLADAGVAEKYRATNRLRVQQQDLVAALAEQKLVLERHETLYQQQSGDLAEIEARIQALQQSSARQGKRKSNEDAVSFDKQMANLEKIKREKTQQMARQRDQMDSIHAKLKAWRTHQPEPPLTEDEYRRIQTAATTSMPAITLAFADHVRDRHSQLLEQYQALDAQTDLTRPHDWFIHARLDRRRIVFHGGPTNSGKTFAALERLKQASKGLYLGPLRLLAVEIYEKLTADGIYCNLYTGQERREIPFATHGAATVEMAVLTEEYDVIVIDEVQMLSDWERGFAWTRALLGSRCKEIHVCGGLEAAAMVQRMVEACGDQFELLTYRRFSELQIASRSLADVPDQLDSYRHVRSGDCVVAFSRNDIFAIKREIETTTPFKCCVIYGSLPPATRSEQARRFNDPDSGYDVLVASDAIGMGLNLNIRRIIFNSVYKNDGTGIVRLDHSAMKQISGRAGRRNSPFPIGGKCTTMGCPV